MMEVAVQRRWLSRLLFGRLGLLLRKEAAGLLVATKNAEQLVSISELAEPVHIFPGPLWSRLSMKTLSQTMSFGGFRKEPLSQLADSLNARLRLYAEDLLESESAGLQTAAKQIASFLNQNAYARDSRRRKLVMDAEKAITVLSHRFWKLFASKTQMEAGTAVSQFIHHSERLVQEANTRFVDREIEAYKEFFDSVEKNPLTEAQRKASVINEDSNLVLAGAGTGKTSTMIGRAGYLLASGQARPAELLMLAFAKKAAEEMQERQDKCLGQWLKEGTPTIKTFHAIGLEIISIAMTVVLPVPVASFRASLINSGLASLLALARWSRKVLPTLPILGATSVNHIRVSTASI
jgi:DNA helicase IV